MKLYTGLFSLVATTLIIATTAQAAGANTTKVIVGEGLMECGESYYKATLTTLPEKVRLTGSQFPALLHFENPNAEAVCGNIVVNSKKTSEDRGAFPYKAPRFVNYDSVKEARAGIIDRRLMVVNKKYRVSCSSGSAVGTVAELREGPISLVRMSFANPRAEQLCGQGRFRNMSDIEFTEVK